MFFNEHFFVVLSTFFFFGIFAKKFYAFLNSGLSKKQNEISDQIDYVSKLRKNTDYSLTEKKLKKQEMVNAIDEILIDARNEIKETKKQMIEDIKLEVDKKIAAATNNIVAAQNKAFMEFDKKFISLAFDIVDEHIKNSVIKNDINLDVVKNSLEPDNTLKDELIH